MGHQTHVRRRGSVYSIRLALPLALIRAREQAGLPRKKEVSKSLHTKDQKLAHTNGPALVARMRRKFDDELAQLVGNGIINTTLGRVHKPSDDEMDVAVWETIEENLIDDNRRRFDPPTEELIRQLLSEQHERVIADMRAGFLDGIVEDVASDRCHCVLSPTL